MDDEDLLKKAQREGKVTIGGKDFPIKPATVEERFFGAPELKPDAWATEYQGTFADPDRVRAPEFLFETNPTAKIEFQPSPRALYSAARELEREDRPEVKLREGIRAALRGGLSQEKIREIFDLELVSHVMES